MRFAAVLLLVAACATETASNPDAQSNARDATAAADAAAPDAAASAPDAEEVDAGLADASAIEDATLADALVIEDAAAPDAMAIEDAAAPDAAVAAPMELLSADLPAGMPIPRDSSCYGADIQPAFDFVNVPPGTQSLAIVLIDDSIDFVHWIALDMPAGTTGLARGASGAMMLPAGTREIQAYGLQYRGPCPRRMHTYSFRLYALSTPMTSYRWPRQISDRNLDLAFANPLAVATLTRTFTP